MDDRFERGISREAAKDVLADYDRAMEVPQGRDRNTALAEWAHKWGQSLREHLKGLRP